MRTNASDVPNDKKTNEPTTIEQTTNHTPSNNTVTQRHRTQQQNNNNNNTTTHNNNNNSNKRWPVPVGALPLPAPVLRGWTTPRPGHPSLF